MKAVPLDSPLASYETKWIASRPELALALKFVDASERPAQSAFACLRLEIEHAAFGIREAQPSATKLQWWAEEFARAGNGEARHPLTQTLATHRAFASVALRDWYAAIGGALTQRDSEPAGDRRALLEGYQALYQPLAQIEATLFAPLDAAAIAQVDALARALRETALLGDALRDGRLPLPLDLLARHRLARGDIACNSPAQIAAVREWLSVLAADMATPVQSGAQLGPLHAAAVCADRWRAGKASAAVDPPVALARLLARLPLQTAWDAWRAGRSSLRSSRADH